MAQIKKFLVILIFCFSCIAFGQKQQIALKAGVNFAQFNAKDTDFKMRTAFHVGVLMENALTSHISLAPELQFSSQGARQHYESTNYEFRLNYVNLPILVRFYPKEKLYLEAGPQVGILVSARQSSDSQKDSDVVNIKGQDYGFNLGVGFKPNALIGFNVRYYFGFRDINDKPNYEKLKNNLFQASLNFYLD